MLQESESTTADAAQGVRDFYERYPYPRPVESLDEYRRLWQDAGRRRADHHVHWPHKRFREDHSILVAGCGTSQAAKHALRWPAARVVGIDLSATSVACTEELKRKHELSNLEVRRLPVERVGELKETFDQIVCTGVLHHLPDPDVGLAALRDVMKPDAAMQLMVYAPYGRTGVYMLQEFNRRLGIAATDADIRDLVAALPSLPAGHPLVHLLRDAPDFRTPAALADALLHPQDRAYSVPQLFDFLVRAGTAFVRWTRQAPYSAACGVLSRIPQAARLAQLAPQEQAAAAELFRGTMVRHSAIVRRDDAPDDGAPIGFEGDAWRGYIPVRMPDTICVEERLPPGAAGVLINRTHSYTDVYLPIDGEEKRLLDCVDGRRTIAEIARDAHAAGDARGLFERLWQHDQVVFDASHTDQERSR